MSNERFEQCLREGKLVKEKAQADLVEKEFKSSEADLKSALNSISESNFKWAIVQAYYSMFHSAKALVFCKDYREKSHSCLLTAFKTLFIEAGILESKHFSRFRDCMDLRQTADYGLVYSKDSASAAVEWAEEFLEAAKHWRKNKWKDG